MPWIVKTEMPGARETIERSTHKEAQHEAAVMAKEHRDDGRQVLGSTKEDYWVIEAANRAEVITIEVYHKD